MSRSIRPIRVEGNIAYVPLSRGYEAVIDASDVHIVDGFNWFAMIARGHIYAVRNRRPRGTGLILMHRVLLNNASTTVVDHINGDSLDNRRANMREATISQNGQNSKLRSDNKSGIKGVSWDTNRNRWAASISYNGRNVALGRFADKDDAARAYATASSKYHGEFGRIA